MSSKMACAIFLELFWETHRDRDEPTITNLGRQYGNSSGAANGKQNRFFSGGAVRSYEQRLGWRGFLLLVRVPGLGDEFTCIRILDCRRDDTATINRTKNIFSSGLCYENQGQRRRSALTRSNINRNGTLARANHRLCFRKGTDVVARDARDVEAAQIRPGFFYRRAQHCRIAQPFNQRLLVLRDDIRRSGAETAAADQNPT